MPHYDFDSEPRTFRTWHLARFPRPQQRVRQQVGLNGRNVSPDLLSDVLKTVQRIFGEWYRIETGAKDAAREEEPTVSSELVFRADSLVRTCHQDSNGSTNLYL